MAQTQFRPLAVLLAAALALLFAGCQELQGPAWSPEGNYVAYTVYSRPEQPGGRVDTAVYLADPEDETGTPSLLAKDAAFPRWTPDGPTVYFLANRDRDGYYTALRAFHTNRMMEQGGLETVLQDPGLRMTSLQLSADGSYGVLGVPSPGAREVRPGAPQLVEFWRTRERTRTPLALGEVLSPAFTPNGRILAFAQKPAGVPDAKPCVAILELDRTPLQPRTVFPTPDKDEPGASGYVIYALPDSETFLFHAPLGRNIWTVRRDGRNLRSYPLPANCSEPLLVSINDDGTTATLTLAKPADGEVLGETYELSFAKGVFTRLDGGSGEWYGGHALDPRVLRRGGAPNWAWLSAAGLAVGAPGRARYYPVSAEQFLAAGLLYLQQKQPAKALAAIQKAAELRPPVADRGELYRAEALAYLELGDGGNAAQAYERSLLLYPITARGLPLLFFPPLGKPPLDVAAARKEFDALVAAAPEAKLLAALRQAFLTRADGKPADAQEHYRKATEVCPSEELVAGVKFLQALAAVENGEMALAGEHFETAARAAGFPQADYAAGLSAIAFALDNRPASVDKASAVLQFALKLKSPLEPELKALPNELRGRAFRQKRIEGDVKSPDGTYRTWVEVTDYLVPQAFLKPASMRDAEGRYADRRLAAMRVTVSEVQVAGLPGGTQTAAKVPFPITVPVFAPAGQMLSFQALGEVVPLGDAFCEAYVFGVNGVLLHGNGPALTTGRLSGRRIIRSALWSGPLSLTLSGSQVDVWGNEKPYDRIVTITPR